MDSGAWWATVHGVTKSRTQLKQLGRESALGQEEPLEKEMATPSSILACKILWTEELGGLQSMGSQRVGHG